MPSKYGQSQTALSQSSDSVRLLASVRVESARRAKPIRIARISFQTTARLRLVTGQRLTAGCFSS
jgi:hypothetical protein